MIRKEVFFLDTNIILKWVYRKVLNESKSTEDFIKSLGREQCVVLDINLSEFVTIILDSYTIFSTVVYNNLRVDWDNLSIKEKLQVLENIRKNFDSLYENVSSLYSSQIPPSGIRQALAKSFFINMYNRIANWSFEEIKRHLVLKDKTDDLIDYINLEKEKISQSCTILTLSNLLIDMGKSLIINQLVDEGIRKFLSRLKQNKFNKTPSRKDQLIFKAIIFLLYTNQYYKIVLITDDDDFKRIHNEVLNHLNDIIHGKADPRGEYKEYAKEIYNILTSRFSIKN
ncbi:hypothetical protein [Acidianus sp. HS-5]|uniref:hypothetical protein n=1 Tax=Acidianus sp. HS-5 TaxID=2886040 RepID=UPI001F212B6E|nr:hypothetical protein [Acidianus sp. HS-5]BDC17723.1 hypothetical protein HS5_06130 [Acidianus sp. HS-5]